MRRRSAGSTHSLQTICKGRRSGKVGPLPRALPQRDEQITATPGDVMLYQGSHLVIFHGTNRYAYTRIGRVRDATRGSMRAALGAGAVTATLSLDKARAARTGQEAGR